MQKSQSEVLKEVEKEVAFEITEARDPKVFFQDRKGLFVGSSFTERIVEKSETISEGKSGTLQSFEILKYSDDATIEKALPEKHLFTESQIAAIVAEFISEQTDGKTGTLLADGNWNLFYTDTCVVGVRWVSGDAGWGVFSWQRGGREWGAGYRVFSPQLTLDF